MTPEQITEAIINSGLTQQELADLLKLGNLTVKRSMLKAQIAKEEKDLQAFADQENGKVSAAIGAMRDKKILPLQQELAAVEELISGGGA